MTAPAVYKAIAAVAADLARTGIAKNQLSPGGGYRYRGIDDVYAGLAPLLAAHRLCILPRMLERHCASRSSRGGTAEFAVTIRAAFDFVAVRDGSCHTVESYGEALDAGDKATAKAMSAAYKYAAFQTFCIPIGPEYDPEATPTNLSQSAASQAMPEDWVQWTKDVADMVSFCETGEAIARVQQTYRAELRALAGHDKTLYGSLGNAFQKRRDHLTVGHGASASILSAPAKPKRGAGTGSCAPDNGTTDEAPSATAS